MHKLVAPTALALAVLLSSCEASTYSEQDSPPADHFDAPAPEYEPDPLPEPEPEPERSCVDVTSYDYDWYNDMLCTRPDGSQFYTDYEGAAEYTY